ncbi:MULTISPECIES: nucleic acid/nucleotide deaminase domain-containing protein [Streptacidiphilus]|uniref:Nucleic acid/nucleotide deaminase domain-containing protein n=1 Tax=Streptacidiphilus cavernicola TaxID=3342716 RepID=A0ABV6UHM0_9ACTN|nr:nucleic acid/nucleotide deaminase domain-containing protein [Streptacidiphilus jeojiense]
MSHPESDRLDEAMTARFGAAGLRRFGVDAAAGDPVAPEAEALSRIAALTLPLQVGPYFRTAAGEPAALREYAVETSKSLRSADHLSWTRLGSDSAYQLVADPDGRIQAMLLGYSEPLRFVSSSPEEFAAALLDLDGLLSFLGATDSPQAAQAAFEDFQRRLQEADPAAFVDRESWWPLVLDDLRDTAGVENFAAFEVVDGSGQKKILTASGAIALHPEERLWASLKGAGVAPEQVTGIHTDLQPCFLPGHYCSMWLAVRFPQAKLTHSFPYGETAASRGEGISRLRAAAAQQSQSQSQSLGPA